MRWLFTLLVCIALSCGTGADAQQGLAPEDARLELHLEERAHTPHPGEMLLLSIQGTFRVPVVREKLIQPTLDGLDWMQLGEDRWYKEMEDGFEVLKFERRMALFPQTPGEIEIAPFTHRVDLLDRRGRGITTELVSNTATLTTAPGPETDAWWFPLRKLEINDSWSNQPEALDPGSAALRIVTLTIDGSPPQRIPPMPEMTGAGAHIFPHPEHRIVALGPDGPRTRVFWRWTIRPELGSAGYLDPIRIEYFDAQTRDLKEIVLSAQRVAYDGGAQQVNADERPTQSASRTSQAQGEFAPVLPGYFVPVSLGLGLLLGLLLARGRGGGLWQWPHGLRVETDLIALTLSAWRGNDRILRHRARRLVVQYGTTEPEALRRLDGALYGGSPDAPDLGEVAASVRQAVRRARRPRPA